MPITPRLNIIAGPNGSGKTTLYQKLSHRFTVPFINADEFAAQSNSITGGGRQAIKERNQLIENENSFTIETTLSGKGPIRLMNQALSSGYDIRLYFVCLDGATKNAQRVQERVAKGGHHIPLEDVERRYQRSLDNLPSALRLASRSYVYDNSGKRIRLVFIRSGSRIRLNSHWSGELPSWLPKLDDIGE